MFFWLKLSDAAAKTATSFTPHSIALSIPNSLGVKALKMALG